MQRFLKPTAFRRLLGSLTVMTVLAGCAMGPTFQSIDQVPPDQGQLYIYRKFSLSLGLGGVHEVRLDGDKEHLRLPHASWQRVLLTPGTHTVAITGPWEFRKCMPYPMEVRIQAGQTLYIENTFRALSQGSIVVGAICPSRLQSAATALEDMAGLRHAN